MRSLVLGAALLALASPVLAGSKMQMNIVPTPADCHSATSICLNSGVACTPPDNAQCARATLLPTSKVSVDGKLRLKGTVKKVRGHDGDLVTTGVEGSEDNYIFRLRLKRCIVDKGIPPCNETDAIYVKVALAGGDGKFTLDLAPVLAVLSPGSGAGDGITISSAALMTAPPPGACAGGNAVSDLIGRLNLAGCEGSGTLGIGGFAVQ